MRASLTSYGSDAVHVWVAQLHERDIAAQGNTSDEAIDNLRACLAGHQHLGDYDTLPVPPLSALVGTEVEL